MGQQCIDPVSYTHLLKQMRPTVMPSGPVILSGVNASLQEAFTQSKDPSSAHGCMRPSREFSARSGMAPVRAVCAPVSYTHLDVYKRQLRPRIVRVGIEVAVRGEHPLDTDVLAHDLSDVIVGAHEAAVRV